VEWVIALRGEAVDDKLRTTPEKHEDTWSLKPKTVVGRLVNHPYP
jgi:hypothetical protein